VDELHVVERLVTAGSSIVVRQASGQAGAMTEAGPSTTSPLATNQDARPDPVAMLAVALQEARAGLAEGGIPIGAALFGADGSLLGRGHNLRVQDGDPSMHAETAAFRAAGRQRSYAGTTMVTTLSPCWYCSGLVRQFGISHLVIGEATTFYGGHDWLAEFGVTVTVLEDDECLHLLQGFITDRPLVWAEDIGEE
jgi:cytosine deaminase